MVHSSGQKPASDRARTALQVAAASVDDAETKRDLLHASAQLEHLKQTIDDPTASVLATQAIVYSAVKLELKGKSWARLHALVAPLVQALVNEASYWWCAANIRLRSVRAPHDGAVFWCGYHPQGNMHRAQAHAQASKGRTVEFTAAGAWMINRLPWDKLVAKFGQQRASQLWDTISRRFAKAASGEVHAFIKGMKGTPDFEMKTYFRLERPLLLSNPRVTKIVEHE